MKISKVALSIVLILILIISCSPNTTLSTEPTIPTKSQVTNPSHTSTTTATASQTPTTKTTSLSATSTITPTPDYSQITLFGAQDIRELYGSATLLILEMGTIRGDFFGIGDGEKYSCEFSKDFPTQLNCFGPTVPYQKKVDFSLFVITNSEPIFNTTFRFSGPPPTPMGMYCEIEPLWTDVLNHIGNVGCYAVTCWINGSYYGGVQDSCKEYWPWIPPGLISTALPTLKP